MKMNLGIDSGFVTFAPGGAGVGTLTFSGLQGFAPARLLAVTNVTRKALVYAAEVSGKGGAWSYTDMTGGVLTLEVSTTGHDAADELRCIYDVPERAPDDPATTVEDICREDGFLTSGTISYRGTYPVSRINVVGGSATTGMGQSYLCKFLTMAADRPCEAQAVVGIAPNTAGLYGVSWDYRAYIRDSIHFPLNMLWGNGAGVTLYLENGDGAPIFIKAGWTGYRVTSDVNWRARRTVLWIGDSIANGSGLTAGTSIDPNLNYPFIVRNWLHDYGFDYRLIQKTSGGQRTTDADYWRRLGMLDLAFPRRTGLIFYNMGANDWNVPTTAQANVEIFVPWALKRHPNSVIILCGPTPAENDTTHAGIETIRASYSAYVTAQANPRLKYINLGTAFDRKDAAYFSSADTPGGRIHPSTTGMAAIGAVLTPFMASIIGDIP